MKKLNIPKIIDELDLRSTGTKGWLGGIECPWCGKSEKFGIKLNEDSISSFNCFRASCGEKGSIFKLFKKIGRLDLIDVNYDYDENLSILEELEKEEENYSNYEVAIIKKPISYKRMFYSEYLEKRGFVKLDYEKYEVGQCTIGKLANNYIVIPAKRNNDWIGYIARSKHGKKWHDENLELSKQNKAELVLRYDNSVSDFSKHLYGEDQVIKGETATVILTEGVFSKIAVDKKLDLQNQNTVVCLACYGQKLSKEQLQILIDFKIQNVILLFDNGTIKSSKSIGNMLNNYFDTKIAYIPYEDKDPDDLTQEQLLDIMSNNLHTPINFYSEKLAEIIK
jgi:hypothetical protein